MKGKILGNGIISGDDGKRYSFGLDEIKNLNGKSENSLANAEVDFEIEGESAKSIFITNTKFSLNSFNDGSLNSIKLKVYIYLGCTLGGYLVELIPVVGPFLGAIFVITGFVFLILALLAMSQMAQVSILPKIIKAWLLTFIGSSAVTISIAAAAASLVFGGNNLSALGAVSIMFIVIGFGMMFSSLYFYHQYFKTLSLITNEKFFIYAFYAKIAGLISMLFIFIPVFGLVIVAIFGIAATVIEVIAWVRFKEVKTINA